MHTFGTILFWIGVVGLVISAVAVIAITLFALFAFAGPVGKGVCFVLLCVGLITLGSSMAEAG